MEPVAFRYRDKYHHPNLELAHTPHFLPLPHSSWFVFPLKRCWLCSQPPPLLQRKLHWNYHNDDTAKKTKWVLLGVRSFCINWLCFNTAKGWQPTPVSSCVSSFSPRSFSPTATQSGNWSRLPYGRCRVGLVRSGATSVLTESSVGLTAGPEGGDVRRLAISFSVDLPQGWYQYSTLFGTVQNVFLSPVIKSWEVLLFLWEKMRCQKNPQT